MKRYGLTYAETLIPMVEAQHPPASGHVVKRFRGFTLHHAYRRALSWARKNGDPR